MSQRNRIMEPKSLYPAPSLLKAISRARKEQSVVGILYSSDHCPFCVAVKKEQLLPRSGSGIRPGFIIVEFDTDSPHPFTLPSGQRTTAKDWGRIHRLSLLPTLVMIDDAANPVAAPLVGYASRDFYPVYLEEAIRQAHAAVTKQRAVSKAAAPNTPTPK